MSAAEEPNDGEDGTSPTRECYRCDRSVAPPFCFTVRVEAPAALSEKYADSTRYCCEHCAAAMNLSDIARRWTASIGRRGESDGG